MQGCPLNVYEEFGIKRTLYFNSYHFMNIDWNKNLVQKITLFTLLASIKLLLFVWWGASTLAVVVWKCSTMECGVLCVMTPGTSIMQM